MAKQFIISAMEEILGEYILNMSKENLKIAALRGKLKLENVQLDGDLIGSHVLGAVGLSGFGILSCSAKSIKISVPWKNLEKEPTKFEVHGVHLVCVPLMPTTAHQMYGAGTTLDPRCTLRTRAKRLVLARLERNFWNGQLPGEGPPMKRVQRAVRELEREMRSKRKSAKRNIGSLGQQPAQEDYEVAIDNIMFAVGATSAGTGTGGQESQHETSSQYSGAPVSEADASEMSFSVEDLPEVPRDWKVKLREKVLRNMEASIYEIHIRVEVSRGALDVADSTNHNADLEKCSAATVPVNVAKSAAAEERAFAMGFTLDSLVVRTASESWQIGSHDKRTEDGSTMSSVQGHLGPNEYVVKNNKIGYFSKLAMYWDDEPPILLAETDLLRGNYKKLSQDKLQLKIALAMDGMFKTPEPGAQIRQSLGLPMPLQLAELEPHQYVVEAMDAEIRVRQSDRQEPGPISCSADVLPFTFTWNIRPHQHFQFKRLKAAMLSQRHLDTMQRQRPHNSPRLDPRAWWRYAITCVTARPNSRPWEDVKRIVGHRSRYIVLVIKKNLSSSDANGYHAGLSDAESAELLEIEDVLPVEALTAFHLVALRRAYAKQNDSDGEPRKKDKSKSFGFARFKIKGASMKRSNEVIEEDASEAFDRPPRYPDDTSLSTPRAADDMTFSATTSKAASLLDAMTLRLGKKRYFIHWKIHDAVVNIMLFGSKDAEPVAQMLGQVRGSVRSFGLGRRDFQMDISQFEILHRDRRIAYASLSGEGSIVEDEEVEDFFDSAPPSAVAVATGIGTMQASPDLVTPASHLELPPAGTVCRIVSGRDHGVKKFSLAAHPVTLIYSTLLFDEAMEFIVPKWDKSTDIAEYIRNAATPLARKAQLALLSPGSQSIHLNVAAPKVWFPVSPRDADGAVFLDAGMLKVAGVKAEGDAEMNWDTRARDIQVNFLRGQSSIEDGSAQRRMLGQSKSDASIVRPFHITVEARTSNRKETSAMDDAEAALALSGLVRTVAIVVSPVCVSLVDAEMLARAFGKVYTRGIHQMKRRTLAKRTKFVSRPSSPPHDSAVHKTLESEIEHIIRGPREMSLVVERVEIALEGHSKGLVHDDRSLASQDSFSDFAPPVRTYLVELFEIAASRTSRNRLSKTEMMIKDAAITRLRDAALYSPRRGYRELKDLQYCILVRSPALFDTKVSFGAFGTQDDQAPILKASLFHDGSVHLDEVEIDIDSVVVRVTPTTLKDCAKASRRLAELAQLTTREMERKVHEEGRKARQLDFASGREVDLLRQTESTPSDRPASPALSEAQTDVTANDGPAKRSATDSSILFKVTLNESTLLAGRPMEASEANRRHSAQTFAVIQVLSNALIMFQSIENPDESGAKTLHISVDNVSSLVHTEFERVPTTHAPPMIGPTGAEFRIVYGTENLGCIVSQDISLDCESMKSCLAPSDLSLMTDVSQKMAERLRAFNAASGESPVSVRRRGPIADLVRYQKRGTGIATTVRAEIQCFSFVLLRSFKTHFGAPEFLDFLLEGAKVRFEGCVSALSGDCSGTVTTKFYNSESADWEYVVEPCPFILGVDQMPNELVSLLQRSYQDKLWFLTRWLMQVLHFKSRSPLQVNVTGILLKQLVETRFDVIRADKAVAGGSATLPTVLSTVGLRRATEGRAVVVTNVTGFDLHVLSGIGGLGSQAGFVADGASEVLDADFDDDLADILLSVQIARSAVTSIGERKIIENLPILPKSENNARLCLLRPTALPETAPGHIPRVYREGRASPDTVFTETSASLAAYYSAEPVVEWCMQNQRLRNGAVDVFSLAKGSDLLSARVWSPEESSDDGMQKAASGSLLSLSEPEKVQDDIQARDFHRQSWIRPYLKNDVPEYTDMTCTLRMARDRVMLPDTNWIWVNDWVVDLGGSLGDATDADGWEYQADFETFTRSKRFYQRGDSCRRRRWTRTRMIRPPRLDDHNRVLKVVWETSVDDSNSVKIVVRSHVRVSNLSGSNLVFFAVSAAWENELLLASIPTGNCIDVPVSLASSLVYIQLGRPTTSSDRPTFANCAVSDRIMILPTSRTGSNFIRTTITLQDVSDTKFHYLVEMRGDRGLIDVIVHPILTIVNLLPCHLECNIGQAIRNKERAIADQRAAIGGTSKRISNIDGMTVASGKESLCTAVDPFSKPHISLRVPGYNWSAWHRLVNRKAGSSTWRPPDSEEDWYFSTKGDADFAEELKAIIKFDRIGGIGDPLLLVLSVECGHSPIVRIYSQYWILDKTGFGCRFSDGFSDLLGNAPDFETTRRSHLFSEEAKSRELQDDMLVPGHQWSIGMSGMSLFFSRRDKITLAIETGAGGKNSARKRVLVRSKWVSPLDISNVMPKTVFCVDELNGPRRFELAFSVTVCPGLFTRTKLITFLPRYQIVNLLRRQLIVAQDGCLGSETRIPSQSSVPFHWEQSLLAPRVRFGAPSGAEKDRRKFDKCWTNGGFRLDRVGITSLRLPADGSQSSIPMVVQAEVRLATKEQSSAVVVVIWSANEQSNPLYMIRNRTPHTILCRQPLQEEQRQDAVQQKLESGIDSPSACTTLTRATTPFECGGEVAPMVLSFLGMKHIEEFVWILRSGSVTCFGFDDPEKPHILEWTCVADGSTRFAKECTKAFLAVDAMGSASLLCMPDGRYVRCQIEAEHSTKVIQFIEVGAPKGSKRGASVAKPTLPLVVAAQDAHHQVVSVESPMEHLEEDEDVAFGLRVELSSLTMSVVDNTNTMVHGREILFVQADSLFFSFSQTREGYHEFEFRLMSLQADNHVHKSYHPVLLFCPKRDEREPLLHMSAVRRLQPLNDTFIFRYAAIRLLEVEIYLDRRTAETIARFIEPVMSQVEVDEPALADWVEDMTANMARKFATPDRRAPRDIEKMVHTANSGRIYFEQLHLHPVRLSLTFTQEWMEWNPGAEGIMVFQFIRGMASIANAPLTFTSFVVAHVFEAPQALFRVVATHYSSQLTKQIFGILGSLAILGAPADFITNVGTGVRDFFYEPINGAVHGPRQFIEGLEAGTQSLARGVFVGVMRGASSVTEVVNANLAGLTADDDFIDERKAHQRLLTDAMSRGAANRTFTDSMMLAGASVARGLKSGAMGIVEQPAMYASKHGPVGFVKGVGKAMLGAVVKPVVGLGDAAVLVMNHMSDATSKKQVQPKIPKRLRRALPSRTPDTPNCVRLTPYDERAAKAQKIVTGGESVDDVYLGHLHIPSHLVIASDQCLWAIDRRSREPWCVSWEEVSHFRLTDGGVRVVVFSQTGLKTYLFQVETPGEAKELHNLLSMQARKMGNSSELSSSLLGMDPESLSRHQIPGIKARQENHVFGSCNNLRQRLQESIKDEGDLVEQCFGRVNAMGSDLPSFLRSLDEEAWSLISSWGQVFSGLSSRRCVVAGIINGTGGAIQIKSSKLVQGGSPCYSIPTREFDAEQGVLHAGGCILFFGWGVVPNLLQAGNVFMSIETNGFVCDLADHKSRATFAEATPGYQVGFLEKSYDESGWWAKYWLLVRARK